MIEMNLYPIMGIYQEIYNPDFKSMSESIGDETGINVFKNINSFFWASILSESTINKLLNILEDQNEYDKLNPKYIAIKNNREYFIKNIKKAIESLSHHSCSQKDFFSYLETLQIFCNMYSKYISNPFVLTIEEGFDVDECSSLDLINNATNPALNPYYNFLFNNCKEIIDTVKPDIVWIRGKIKLSTITLAIWAKRVNPNVHISVVGHSSEYYSLNKIVEYLKENKCLFSIVDSIVLDDSLRTMKQLYNCLENKGDLSKVKNILYVDRSNGKIKQNDIEIFEQNIVDWTSKRRKEDIKLKRKVAASELVNIKLWPNSKCFWNKCTFCGINQKYDKTHYTGEFLNVNEIVNYIEQLYLQGCKFFWFIDEAIPPKIIMEFSKCLIHKNIQIYWQIRSRIDYDYNSIDFELLYRAGLREIRLGLESASSRIRDLMNKFPTDIDNDYIENLVKKFNDNGISVHFPMIIGFPTETKEERLLTYEFLTYLHNKYSLVTFNINILGLDVSSILFNKFWEFGISAICFPCSPSHFLGNIVDWNSYEVKFERETLDIERNSIMRNVLYPWMPTNCFLPIYVFYRLSETSRNTLVWKCQKHSMANLDVDSLIIWSDANSYVEHSETSITIYNLNSHHLIYCDDITIELIKEINGEKSIREVIVNMLTKNIDKQYDWNYYQEQIENLYYLGFVEKIPNKDQEENYG